MIRLLSTSIPHVFLVLGHFRGVKVGSEMVFCGQTIEHEKCGMAFSTNTAQEQPKVMNMRVLLSHWFVLHFTTQSRCCESCSLMVPGSSSYWQWTSGTLKKIWGCWTCFEAQSWSCGAHVSPNPRQPPRQNCWSLVRLLVLGFALVCCCSASRRLHGLLLDLSPPYQLLHNLIDGLHSAASLSAACFCAFVLGQTSATHPTDASVLDIL